MVFYRKYRSQTINELDSKSVRERLLSVLSKKDTIPHAFLFTGPKGLGKTSTARIVAKVVNCERSEKRKVQSAKLQRKTQSVKEVDVIDQIEPCNECEQCKSITNGTNMDVLEIDAASNRGIDEIRDLREKIRLSPLTAAKKVYIIDEVHMLTTEAFNALLKTLEEPPMHAMFVLCTTEPHKVPATIVSRCFHIQFKPATGDEIVRSLKRIVAGEKLQIADEVLPLIAQRSEGGFRDAAKILEELSFLAQGQEITIDLVDGVYKVSSIKHQVLSIFDAFVRRDASRGLKIIESLITQGVDLKFFLQQMMEFLHEKLLEQAGIERNFQFPTHSTHSIRSGQASSGQVFNFQFKKEEIILLFELLSKAYAEMRYAVLPQLPLELAIIDFINNDNAKQTRVESSKDEVTLSSLRKQAGAITKIKVLYGSAKQNSSPKGSSYKDEIKKTIELMQVPASGEITPEWTAVFWAGILAEMKRYNHTIAGVLRSCSIKNYDKKRLVIETAYKFHKERLETPQTLRALRGVCKTLTGKDVKIEVELIKQVKS